MMTVRRSSLEVIVQGQFFEKFLLSFSGKSSKSGATLPTFRGIRCLHEFIMKESKEAIKAI